LAQEYFTTTSTNFINGLPFDIKTFQVTDPAARALGATDLKPEKSTNFSGGFTFDPTPDFSASIDYYNIRIRDRVVLSSNFTGTSVTNYLTGLGFPGIGGGRYFTNGVDTRTEGVDVTARYKWKFTNGDNLTLTAGVNFNETRVTYVKPTPANVLVLSGGTPIFDRQSVYRFEQGTPRNTYTASAI
jgi:iron complex outermembrane receptor protein